MRLRRTSPAPPVRHVHLGLGSFFRAHQAWYTHRASDADAWGIAAFSGRSAELARTLAAQDGLFTLDVRGPDGDELEVVTSLVRTHGADDDDAWLTYLADPAVAILTTTVTEAGYLRGPDGHLDAEHPDVVADLARVRTEPSFAGRTAPVRIAVGLLARRDAGAGPIALVPCDNLQANGAALRAVVHDAAALLDPTLPAWVEENVAFVTTMVDRITPRPTEHDVALVRSLGGYDDPVPVVTEPFSEWVLEGDFPAGRPRWEDAGARFTDDIEPFEQRKLALLNGAHSLLAYAGLALGQTTVSEAIADPRCRDWVEQWWDEAAAHLPQPAGELDEYRAALVSRFANPAIRHLLAQIATDGSKKLRERVVPTLLAERAAGRGAAGAARVLAAWVTHVRAGQVDDVAAERVRAAAQGPLEDAVPRLLDLLGLDDDVVPLVLAQVAELERAAA